jgi:predicted NBD/HSP70 family sugar kinase
VIDDLPRRGPDRAVLDLVATHGSLDRATIARLLGLPRSTVGDAVARLRAGGDVVEGPDPGRVGRRRGRPATTVRPARSPGCVAVLALTNGVLEAALVGYDGTVLAACSTEASLADFAEGIVDPAARLLEEAVRAAGAPTPFPDCAVLCLPVPVRTGGVPYVPRPSTLVAPERLPQEWRRFAEAAWLRTDPALELAARLGVPAWTENDANLAALGELHFGAAVGLRDLLYLKLVVGVGAGVVLGGRLHRGRGGMAGELAHLHLAEDGPVCICGGRGCLMTQFSSPRLVDLVQHAHAHPLTLDDVLDLAEHGDRGVLRVLEDLGATLGRSLADLCVYLDLEGIVVDGMLRGAAEPVVRGIRRILDRHVQPQVAEDVRLLAGALGARAELLGAVALARDKRRSPVP